MKCIGVLLIVLTALAASAAQAQLPLPQTPSIGGVLDRARGQVDRTLDTPLQEVRRLQIRDLLRTHRRELEADGAGQPIVRSQILALGISADAIARARALGFEIVRTDAVEGAALVTLRAPANMSTRRALARLRREDPNGAYDFDHLHLEAGPIDTVPAFAQAAGAAQPVRIGLIDSGPGQAANVVAQRGFASATPVAGAHGAAIAALLGEAAPGARIYAADIYGGVPTGGASSALARALGWLAQENVAVLNISLVGPRNRIVEGVIERMVARGFVIVAAVGNDGPAAPALYPAAYDGVVGVTGVDRNARVLPEAGRGAHVDFAALGVHGRARGTSYAAPVAAARLAAQMHAPDRAAADRAFAAVRAQTRDLGAPGRDPIYGYGLLAAP